MKIIDIHAHVYKKVAGITQGQPMTGETLGQVKIGNRLMQFLPPCFEQVHSSTQVLVQYMDWCGVDKALLMANPYYGYTNDYFMESVAQYPERLKGVALVDILQKEKAAQELANLYDTTSLFGFKIETNSTFQCAPDKHIADEDLSPVWDCCNQYHQPVFLHLFTRRDLEDLKQLVTRWPQITFVICHMGADACFAAGQSADNFMRCLELVKTNKNVFIDTSTVPVYFAEEFPFVSAVKIIEQGYNIVGAEKMMWASDYPGMLNHATMHQLISYVMNHCRIPAQDMELIMGENADRLFFQRK
ncbi:MAG: amidohydrolase family protein [Ruthenibacterium sp.]